MSINDRKQREFERREEGILQAALGLIGKGDWPSITMDHIAEQAEVGKGTIYKHFRSKDEVAARLMIANGRQLLARWDRIDPNLPFIARFKAVLRNYWEHNMERSEMQSVEMYCDALDKNLNLSEAMQAEHLGVRKAIIDFATEMLAEGVRLGILRNANVEHLLLASWGAVSGITQLVQTGNFDNLDESAYLDYLCEFMLVGMMTTDVQSPPKPPTSVANQN